MKAFIKCGLFLTFTVFLCCVNTEIAAPGGEGNGSETIACGIILDSAGIPAANVAVQLLPAIYNPVAHDTNSTIWHTISNSKGEYHLSRIAAGTYKLEAGSASTGVKALINNVEISGKNTEMTIDTGSLQKTGTVIIRLAGINVCSGDYVYVPGTNTYKVISATDSTSGRVTLNDMPSGVFTEFIYVAAANSKKTDLLDDTLLVQPGDTMEAAYASWKYSGQIVLNTTVSGANILGSVYNFPVLVRLDTTTFTFAQSKNNGEDIRFTKSDGSPLEYEIERWDMQNNQAEIWVKIDTVYGNNNVQFIRMYWGNPLAVAQSNSMMVFDTCTGFQGIWHLGESAGNVLDASINKIDGTRNGNQRQCPGYIGYGQYFDGSGDFAEIMNVENPDISGFTACAWVKHAVSKERQTIIAKSRGSLPSSSYGWLVALDQTGALQAFAASDTGVWGDSKTMVLTSKTVITDTISWHHIAVVIDRSGSKNCHLFIDGVDVTIPTGGDISTVGSIVNSFPMRIGSDMTGVDTQWKGSLDECSFALTVRSTDWVKLSYMNQRKDDKLIIFK
jgi:hypothetical protein